MLHVVLLVKSTDYPSFASRSRNHFLILPIEKILEVEASKDCRESQVLSKQLVWKCQNGSLPLYYSWKIKLPYSLLGIKMPNLLHFYLTDRICKLCKFPNFAEMLSSLLSDKYRRSRLDNWKNSLGNDCKVKLLRLKSKCLNFCKYPI